MTRHIHAEDMLQYAQDAMETDKPWERWETLISNRWESCSHGPCWFPEILYRRKPPTRTVEIPQCVTEPLEAGKEYWVAFDTGIANAPYIWTKTYSRRNELMQGRIFLTREDRDAFEAAVGVSDDKG